MGSPHRKSHPHLRLVAVPAPRAEDAAPAGQPPRTPEEIEAELIADLLSAAPKKANDLYRYLAPVVHASLFKVLGRVDDDHEDLMQSAFEQIAVSIIDGKFARSCRLTTWASVIAARTGLMAIRSRKRARRHQGPGLDDISPEPEQPADSERITAARESLSEVRAVLASMSEDRA
ncbi:MAG: sigma-70 family RNA polymerase sigma factor, partial [Myxococcales bacterium]|nr:sigma-70 family RNA polymerase sigma factor [Myxococcales bacterium]